MDALIDHTAIEAVYRHEAGRVLATLIRLVGDFELAEEGAQDAFEAALARWPQMGLPANPRAWLVNTGRNKAIDRLRRRIVLRGKLKALGAEAATCLLRLSRRIWSPNSPLKKATTTTPRAARTTRCSMRRDAC